MTPPAVRAAPDADAAWAALAKALEDTEPPCAGDDLFTADSPSKDDQEFMRNLCAMCPLLAECASYALAAKPAAGYWAGRRYGKPRAKPKTTSTTADRTASGTHHQ
ncbi:WhiB family transcriptional regulator [Microbacterium sp.]|uniref:WhiB family transcriptional regulator n=1 Tax=Microbacterium sp. TaxID=51671 RepID=UPI0039E60A32